MSAELDKKENIIIQEKSPIKKKIYPFLHKLYNILEVSKKILTRFIIIYRTRIIKILLDGIKKEMAS